jgi:HSP20 family protein
MIKVSTLSFTLWNKHFFSNPSSSTTISAPLDLIELPSSFYILIDLPGFRKSQVSMHVQDGLLVICGERPSNQEAENEMTTHIAEREFGHFFRQIRLSKSADLSKITAWLENGKLEVFLLI